jgi:hypothetical protein
MNVSYHHSVFTVGSADEHSPAPVTQLAIRRILPACLRQGRSMSDAKVEGKRELQVVIENKCA